MPKKKPKNEYDFSLKGIANHLKPIFKGFSKDEALSDYYKIVSYTISNSSDSKKTEEWERREDEAVKLIKKYGEYNTKLISESFAMLLEVIMEDAGEGIYKDWLVELSKLIYIQEEFNNKYYTNYEIAKKVIKSNTNIDSFKYKDVSVYKDKNVGTGTSLIALCDLMQENNIDYTKKLLVYCEGLNQVESYMAYIQLSFIGVAGRFIIDNKIYDTPMLKTKWLKFKEYIK
ncbi:MAG: hypothetical protein K5765_06365 [Clostridia bacterium]|nr:hypothetical protein [Clostridia bacterium]